MVSNQVYAANLFFLFFFGSCIHTDNHLDFSNKFENNAKWYMYVSHHDILPYMYIDSNQSGFILEQNLTRYHTLQIEIDTVFNSNNNDTIFAFMHFEDSLRNTILSEGLMLSGVIFIKSNSSVVPLISNLVLDSNYYNNFKELERHDSVKNSFSAYGIVPFSRSEPRFIDLIESGDQPIHADLLQIYKNRFEKKEVK